MCSDRVSLSLVCKNSRSATRFLLPLLAFAPDNSSGNYLGNESRAGWGKEPDSPFGQCYLSPAQVCVYLHGLARDYVNAFLMENVATPIAQFDIVVSRLKPKFLELACHSRVAPIDVN